MKRNVLLCKNLPSQDFIDFLEFSDIGIQVPINELPQSDIRTFSYLILSEKDNLSTGKLKTELARKRHKYHIISVNADSASMSSLIARDGRVDAVWLTSTKNIKNFNLRYARRLKENNKFIILDLSKIVINNMEDNKQFYSNLGV